MPYRSANAEQKNAARAAHRAGTAARDDGDHQKALSSFREAHGKVAHPKMRMLIVRELRALERFGEAYDEAKLLIKDADLAATSDDKLKQTSIAARDQLREIGELVGFIRLNKPPSAGSALRVNGRVIPASAWAEPIAAKTGSAEISVDGNTTSAKIVAGQETPVTLAAPVAKIRPEETSSGYSGPDRRIMAISAGGVGIVGLTLFGIFGAASQGQFDRLEGACDGNNYCDPNLAAIRDRGESSQLGANISLSIGLIGLAAGGALFTWDLLDPAERRSKSKEKASFRPSLRVGPTSLSLQGAF